MQFFRLVVFSLFLVFFAFRSAANENIDSLRSLYRQAKTDSMRLAINNEIIWKYLFTDKERAQRSLKSRNSS